MLAGIQNFYLSCVRGNVPVLNIAAVPAAMLDDVSHQAEFLSKQASKQAICQYSEFRSDFLLFSAIFGEVPFCLDCRNNHKNFQSNTATAAMYPVEVFVFCKNKQPQVSA